MDLESVQKAYKRYSDVYDLLFGSIFHPGRKAAVAQLDCQPGQRLLEVGVGTGLSLPLYPSFVQVHGIDLSEPMLNKARQRVERFGLKQISELRVMNAQQMEFEDNTFDGAVAMYVASVVPDRKQFVAEVKRVCKPGARVVFLNHFARPKGVLSLLERSMKRFSPQLGFYPDLTLERFVEETGFQVDQKIPVNLFGYWSLLVGKNQKT